MADGTGNPLPYVSVDVIASGHPPRLPTCRSPRRTEGLVSDVTQAVLEAAGLGEEEAQRVWVLIPIQPDGAWGADGQIIHFAELQQLATMERAAATRTTPGIPPADTEPARP